MSFTPARPGYQNQHLIPQGLKDHPVLRALGNVFDIHDNRHNRLELPTRAAEAQARREEDPLADVAGVAIWASVSDEADARITEQVKAGVFPIRLKPEDWTSGTNYWLLDVIAPDPKATARVIANFKQVVKEGSLKLHPLIARLVEPETLKKMGAERMGRGEGETTTGAGHAIATDGQ